MDEEVNLYVQINAIRADSLGELNEKVNEFLEGIDANAFQDIKYQFEYTNNRPRHVALVIYYKKREK